MSTGTTPFAFARPVASPPPAPSRDSAETLPPVAQGEPLIYWSSCGLPRPARLVTDRGGGLLDLVVLSDRGVEPLPGIRHARGPGSWSRRGEDPGEGVVRAGGRPIEIGARVTYVDPRRGDRAACIARVRLVGRGQVVADLRVFDGGDAEEVVVSLLDIPAEPSLGSSRHLGVADVKHGNGPGRWHWLPA
jgi:hypothetical protein